MSNVPLASTDVSSAPTPEQVIKSLQEQVEALAAEAEHLGRLAVLGTLAATLAHEFNNVVTPMASYARLGCAAICEEDPDNSDLSFARRALGKCEHAATRAGRISSAILSMARPTLPDESPRTSAVEAIENVLGALVRTPAQDSIEFTVDVPTDLTLQIESVQLEQVLLNLFLNARRALMNKQAADRTLCVTAESGDEEKILLHITDTGSGIEPEQLEKIFEPFSTTEAAGNGLGLHLCRRILERAGGTISVESHVGRGSRFTLTLARA